MKINRLFLIVSMVFFTLKTTAFELQTKGFLSFGYSRSNTEKPYQATLTKDGEYTELTRAGLQFSSVISHKTEAFVQALADGSDGRDVNFSLDIAHITHNFNNKHKLLVGKIRLPVWLISEYLQVSALYPWINPPEEVYELVPFDDIGGTETFFGASFEGQVFRNSHNQLNYRIYNGGSESHSNGIQSRVENLHGITFDYLQGDLELKLNYLNMISSAEQEDDLGKKLDVSKGRTEYFSVGLRFDTESYIVMSEMSQVYSETTSFEDVLSYYVMGGLYFDDQKYLLHATYSEVSDNAKSDLDLFQETLSLGLNYHLDYSTVLKFEAKRVFLPEPPKFEPGKKKPKGSGLFDEHPDKDVDIISVSISTIF